MEKELYVQYNSDLWAKKSRLHSIMQCSPLGQ